MALIVSNADPYAASVSLGYNTQKAATAFQTNAPQLYNLPEPKTGIFATVFPGESTWHSLYNHDYREIANHIFSIGTMDAPQQVKEQLTQRVKDITIESYEQAAMGWMYKFLLLGTIVLIVMLYIDNNKSSVQVSAGDQSVFTKDGPPIKAVVVITALLAGLAYMYATIWARGNGEAYWQEFSNDLNGKLQTGRLAGDILKEYGANVERERDRQAMARVQNHSTTAGSAALSGLVGGLIGSMIR